MPAAGFVVVGVDAFETGEEGAYFAGYFELRAAADAEVARLQAAQRDDGLKDRFYVLDVRS